VRKLLVTGGSGFIGSNLIRHLLAKYEDYEVVNLDKLTYAGNPENLRDLDGDRRYSFIHGDICDPAVVANAMDGAWGVLNLAAETHVDRSLINVEPFIHTDIYGAFVVLEAARKAGVERFLHMSTDEVYGPRFPEDPARETDVLTPANPYAASKAGGEQQCLSYFRAYGLPVVVARSRNNIGPWQHVEKVVPLFITNALDGLPLPLYGEGSQVRDHFFVEDNCAALDLLLHQGVSGEAYNLGADNERSNLEVAETILAMLEKPLSLVRLVQDRAAHDARYSLDMAKLQALGWSPAVDYENAMERTVAWYRDNRWWWQKVKSGDYATYYERQYSERLERSRGLPD
jgi:dTDP-glucose 4,6-dehydratase